MAVIDILPDEVVFLVGDTIYMEAYNSSPNCGYISGYRWRVDGVTKSTSGYFIPNLTLQTGEDSRSFDIQLRVQNSVGNYGYKTVTITIVREHSSYYYLTDHLGSVRVTVDDDGNSVGWDDYYPFGLQMPGRTQNASNPNDDAKFTEYLLEQDGDLGLYHAEARTYDPVIGRFMQVDPILFDLTPNELIDFQNGYLHSFTPYNYTFNNPLIYVDPDGRSIVSFMKIKGSFSKAWENLKEGNLIDAANEAIGATMNAALSLTEPTDIATDLMPGGLAIKSAKVTKSVINRLISSATRIQKGKTERGIQALSKKIGRGDEAYKGLKATKDNVNMIIEDVMSSENKITSITRNQQGVDVIDHFNPDTGQGIRLIKETEEFDTFINYNPRNK